MKLLYCLPILLLGLTNCTNVDWGSVARTYFEVSDPYLKMAQDRADWKSATPQERQWKLNTGEYPDPVMSDMMKKQYKEQKEWEKQNQKTSKL